METLRNSPPSPVEAFREMLARYKKDAAAFETITDANAQTARDHIGYGSQLSKDIDGERDHQKRPHLEAGREIDAAFKPLIAECEEIAKALKRKLAAHLDAKEREARRIAEEKARALREAEEAAAKAAEPEDDPFLAATAPTVDVAAAHAEAKTAEAEALAASRVGSAAGGFKAAGLRTVRKAKVTDWPALVAHYATHPEVRALAERLANADIRHAKGAPVNLPGVEIVEERVL